MRSQPTQERSQATVERILETADQLVAEHGVHGFRLTDIPALANVTSGSIYRFFPSKTAILEELGRRYVEAFDEELEPILRALEAGFDADCLDRLLTTYVTQFRTRPGFRALWLAREQLPRLRDADLEHDARMGAALRTSLRGAGVGAQRSEAAARLIVAVANPMLTVGLDDEPAASGPVLDEAGRMLRTYVARLIEDAPTPS